MSGKKILIVDDSPTEMALIEKALSSSDFQLTKAVDGEDALATVQVDRPDLIVLDVVLPKKNGFQVCRQLKTSPDTADIKIIMLSTKGEDSDRFWGLKQGADDYMSKPFDPAELLTAIAKLV